VNEFAGSFDRLFWSIDNKAPIDVGEVVRAHIEHAQAVYETAVENMNSYGDAIDMAVNRQHALARELKYHILDQTHANFTAAIEVAEKVANSHSVYDALKIQTEFVQAQSERLLDQICATMSLSIKMGSAAIAIWGGDSIGL
jgi:hypothetical protein